MCLIFNKKIVLLAVTACAFVLFLIFAVPFNHTVDTATQGVKTIIVDPGHGGIDGGAVGVDGTLEKDINLQIGKILAQKLGEAGYNVILTRDEDISLHTKEDATIRNQKREDLKKRIEIANSSNASAYIGIHLNKFEEGKYKGAQVFYSKFKGSKELGEIIQKTLIDELKDGNSRVAKPSEDIYLLKNTKLPSVIVECGFLSNKDELALLKTPEYQEKIAIIMLNAINKFFEMNVQ